MSCWTDPQGQLQCPYNDGDQPSDCIALEEDPACGFITSECIEGAVDNRGICFLYEATWDCGTARTIPFLEHNRTLDCAGPVRCLGTDCAEFPEEQSAGFAKAVGALQTVQMAVSDMQCTPGGSCRVFSGSAHRCQRAVGGIVNCCTRPQGVSLADYVSLIFALGKIDAYCKQEVLTWCVEKRESDCCFNTPLARILNQQIRPQFGRDWGEAQSPECSGIDIRDFARVDWTRVNLDEWLAILYETGHFPTLDTLTVEDLTGEFYVVDKTKRRLPKDQADSLSESGKAPTSPRTVPNPWQNYDHDWDWITTTGGLLLNYAGCLDREEIDRREDEGVARAMDRDAGRQTASWQPRAADPRRRPGSAHDQPSGHRNGTARWPVSDASRYGAYPGAHVVSPGPRNATGSRATARRAQCARPNAARIGRVDQ
nr:conjugal transfer protein TraN [Thiocapsa imhoffii]